jgi:hypothetical protein
MRRLFYFCGAFLLFHLFALLGLAQQEKLVGRWEGIVQAPQGERPTWLVFKKEGEALTGTMQGMRPGSENQLKDIKVEGNKITAKTEVQGPQGTVALNYTFTLEGEALNGQAAADFGGQSFTFDIKLKRAGESAAAPAQPAPQASAPPQGQAQPASSACGITSRNRSRNSPLIISWGRGAISTSGAKVRWVRRRASAR